jgi:hypothetical protein
VSAAPGCDLDVPRQCGRDPADLVRGRLLSVTGDPARTNVAPGGTSARSSRRRNRGRRARIESGTYLPPRASDEPIPLRPEYGRGRRVEPIRSLGARRPACGVRREGFDAGGLGVPKWSRPDAMPTPGRVAHSTASGGVRPVGDKHRQSRAQRWLTRYGTRSSACGIVGKRPRPARTSSARRRPMRSGEWVPRWEGATVDEDLDHPSL